MLLILLRREVKLYFRKKTEFLQMFSFFIIILSLFPFAISPESSILKAFGPGIIWIATFLYSTLTSRFILEDDFKDGSLELLIIKSPVLLIVLAKFIAHFICCFLPLLPLILICSIAFKIDSPYILLISLLCGIPSISLICMLISSLTTGLRNASVLTSLIMIPLLIPILIFGVGTNLSGDELLTKNLMGLLALLFIYAPLSLWASALSIRSSE